jgi:hypothetical protein
LIGSAELLMEDEDPGGKTPVSGRALQVEQAMSGASLL